MKLACSTPLCWVDPRVGSQPRPIAVCSYLVLRTQQQFCVCNLVNWRMCLYKVSWLGGHKMLQPGCSRTSSSLAGGPPCVGALCWSQGHVPPALVPSGSNTS
jgi:hypothetical protein